LEKKVIFFLFFLTKLFSADSQRFVSSIIPQSFLKNI
jgi:hypothetical protein